MDGPFPLPPRATLEPCPFSQSGSQHQASILQASGPLETPLHSVALSALLVAHFALYMFASKEKNPEARIKIKIRSLRDINQTFNRTLCRTHAKASALPLTVIANLHEHIEKAAAHTRLIECVSDRVQQHVFEWAGRG